MNFYIIILLKLMLKGVVVLLCIINSLFNWISNNNVYSAIMVVCAVFLIFVVIVLWLNRKDKIKSEKLQLQEIEDCKAKLQKLKEENESLKKNNDVLSEIIHKNNKLIPSMQLAVKELVNTSENNSKEVNGLLCQLDKLSKERYTVLKDYEHSHKKLPSTNIATVDAVIKYLLLRANECDITFDFSTDADIKYMTENIISEKQLNTLLTDLTENAIIATNYSQKKNVLLQIIVENQHYKISVFDSGINFEPITLARLGNIRSTTNKTTGGSGIGMMTTFDIKREYNASFEIIEMPENSLYTKQVAFCLDNLGEFRVKTDRMDALECLKSRDDVIIIRK